MHKSALFNGNRFGGTVRDMHSHGSVAIGRTSIVRRAVERLLGPLVIKRHLPNSVGAAPLIVSGRVGGMKYLFRRSSRWDPQLLRIAAMLVSRGTCVWDVGANVGLFSRAAAFYSGASGTVLALEADIDAVVLLSRTCRYQPPGHADITVVPVAVCAAVGFAKFDIAIRARAANALTGFGTTQTGGVRESRTLPSVTLDSMLGHFRAPDLLKIDVEGAELVVLGGATQIIKKFRPAIYCEVQRDTLSSVSALLVDNNYRLWDGDHFSGGVSDPAVSVKTSNVLALPEERVEQAFVGP